MTPDQGWNPYWTADGLRRFLGAGLDAAGWGPLQTPYSYVHSESGVSLRRYSAEGVSDGPVVLIVPAPIKAAYIWDAAPSVSVVQRSIEAECRLFMVEWARPDTCAKDIGLDDYANRLLLNCIDVIRAETGEESSFLMGHSLGGTFAAFFAALHPRRIRGLILIGAPLNFGPHVGPLDRMVAASPPASVLTALEHGVPGSLLNVFSSTAAPASFLWSRWLDALTSAADPDALRTHLLVTRWSLDEAPLAGRLFEEVVEHLYRENRFTSGNLMIDGMRVTPAQVVAPMVNVVDRRCRVVPPEAVLPFHQAAGSVEKLLLWYPGDAGVALRHVGPLVGKKAHLELWPRIMHWIHVRPQGAPAADTSAETDR